MLPANITLLEDFDECEVVVRVDGKEVFRHEDYSGSAVWAQKQYKLSDAQLIAIYRKYKDDYDAHCD